MVSCVCVRKGHALAPENMALTLVMGCVLREKGPVLAGGRLRSGGERV